MSLTIDTNKLKFVIFASGHDYTLADSGDGDVQIFSHPYVPKGSKNYAGQYYFLVPDENGDPIDAVMDDRTHCTFTPALGTTFSTVGQTTVEVHYYREYIHDEETIVVDKTVSQIIEVVNHGSKSETGTNLDIYSDGYGFIRPVNVNTVEEIDYVLGQKNAVKKLSSIPWRATGLGGDEINTFFSSTNLTDVSELAFADTSKCTKFMGVFGGCSSLSDISAVENWIVDNVETIYHFGYYSAISSLEALANWQTQSVTSLYAFLQHDEELTSLHGLENWNVSNVEDMSYICDMCVKLSDISAVALWNVEKVETLQCGFIGTLITNTNAFAMWNVPSLKNIVQFLKNCEHITDLAGLSNWTAELEEIKEAFMGCTPINDISGIHGLDVHMVEDFTSVFEGCTKILSLNGLEGWIVSNGQVFYRMFKGDMWIEDISAIAGWIMTNATNTSEMFYNDASITSLADVNTWRMSPASMDGMCKGNSSCYSSKIGKKLYETAYYFYDYADNQYTNAEVQDVDNPLSYPTYNAYGARSWGVSGSNKDAFDNKWTNRPSWN